MVTANRLQFSSRLTLGGLSSRDGILDEVCCVEIRSIFAATDTDISDGVIDVTDWSLEEYFYESSEGGRGDDGLGTALLPEVPFDVRVGNRLTTGGYRVWPTVNGEAEGISLASQMLSQIATRHG